MTLPTFSLKMTLILLFTGLGAFISAFTRFDNCKQRSYLFRRETWFGFAIGGVHAVHARYPSSYNLLQAALSSIPTSYFIIQRNILQRYCRLVDYYECPE